MGCFQSVDTSVPTTEPDIEASSSQEISLQNYDENVGLMDAYFDDKWHIINIIKTHINHGYTTYSYRESPTYDKMHIFNPENVEIENLNTETNFDNLILAPLHTHTTPNPLPITIFEPRFNIKTANYYYSSQQQKGYILSLVDNTIYKYNISDKNWINIDIDVIFDNFWDYKISIDSINHKLYLLSLNQDEHLWTFRVYDLETNQWILKTKTDTVCIGAFGSFVGFYSSFNYHSPLKDIQEILANTLFAVVTFDDRGIFAQFIINTTNIPEWKMEFIGNNHNGIVMDVMYSNKKYVFITVEYDDEDNYYLVVYSRDDDGDTKIELKKEKFNPRKRSNYRMFESFLMMDSIILILFNKSWFDHFDANMSYFIDTIWNKTMDYKKEMVGRVVLYDQVQGAFYSVSKANKKEVVGIKDVLPDSNQFYMEVIVNGYVKKQNDLFIPFSVINLIVTYANFDRSGWLRD